MISKYFSPTGFDRLRRYVVAGLVIGIAATWSLSPGQVFACNKEKTAMPSNIDCSENAITRSRCIIEAILQDISENYGFVGGGGITSIKQDSTWTYTVSIAQEERIDKLTYTVSISSDGQVNIDDRESGVESFDQ